jgi:hypothetical protein
LFIDMDKGMGEAKIRTRSSLVQLLVAGLTIQALSLLSSSFIEEEHQANGATFRFIYCSVISDYFIQFGMLGVEQSSHLVTVLFKKDYGKLSPLFISHFCGKASLLLLFLYYYQRK